MGTPTATHGGKMDQKLSLKSARNCGKRAYMLP